MVRNSDKYCTLYKKGNADLKLMFRNNKIGGILEEYVEVRSYVESVQNGTGNKIPSAVIMVKRRNKKGIKKTMVNIG